MVSAIFRRVLRVGFCCVIAFLFFGMSTPVAAQGCTTTDPASGRVISVPCPQPQPQPPGQQPPAQQPAPGQQPQTEGQPQLPPPKIAPVEINPNTNTNPIDTNTNLNSNLPNGQPQMGIEPTLFQLIALVGLGIIGFLTVVGIVVIRGSNEYKYVPVRRLLQFLEGSLNKGTKWNVFEPNGTPERASGDSGETNTYNKFGEETKFAEINKSSDEGGGGDTNTYNKFGEKTKFAEINKSSDGGDSNSRSRE